MGDRCPAKIYVEPIFPRMPRARMDELVSQRSRGLPRQHHDLEG